MNSLRRNVTRLAQGHTAKVRAEYTTRLREDFRDYAIHDLMAEHPIEPIVDHFLPQYFASWHIHHIQPISLGGTNAFVNLALVSQEMHKEIHYLIDRQTVGLAIGESKTIDLPFMEGHIWKQPALTKPQRPAIVWKAASLSSRLKEDAHPT